MFVCIVSRFGVGYHMVLVKDHERKCDEDLVTQKVTSTVPGSRLVGNAGAELAYVLPQEASSHFSNLFTALEGMLSPKYHSQLHVHPGELDLQ